MFLTGKMSLVFVWYVWLKIFCFFFLLVYLLFFAVAQKAANVHMITAHMDTTNAAAALLTGSVIIMLTITETAQCLLPLAQEVALLGEALRHRTHILTLEFEIPSPSRTPHGVTCTEMTEEDELTERTITVGVDRLTLHSLDTHPHSGRQDRTLNPLIPPRERHSLLEEDLALSHGVDLRVLTQSAVPAAQAAAGVRFSQVFTNDHYFFLCHHVLHSNLWVYMYICLTTVIPTAPQVMALEHAPFSPQPHMRRLSPLWWLTPMSPVVASESRFRTYQFAPRVSPKRSMFH